MKMLSLFPLALAAALSACQDTTPSSDGQPAQEATLVATASIIDQSGSDVGAATLNRYEGSVVIDLTLEQFEPGAKAFHLHSAGKCDSPDFKSAGGHLNPDGHSHGKLNPNGQHLGDLPNLEIPADGTVRIQIDLGGQADPLIAALSDDDGTAIMIHAGPDDYVSDPAGAAGPRIACGVLQMAAQPANKAN